ncbi:MAG: DNA polymerase III subunit delta' [Flavobacteriia bacterium]|nr:DNA polymerase III subunit delta' [Flavobacteriia bacterium]
MNWKGVVGQKRLITQLENLIQKGQVPHAQLISGPVGHGMLSLALAFSKNLLSFGAENAQNPNHPDLHFIYPVVKKGTEKHVFSSDYASEWAVFVETSPYGSYAEWFEAIGVGNKQGHIGVAEIEKLHQKMQLKAFGGRGKVCILWGAEKMNGAAANAFLKLLEEPPKNTFFILLVEDVEQVLPTVYSRCQPIALGPIEHQALLENIPSDFVGNKEQMVAIANGDFARLHRLLSNEGAKSYEALLVEGLRTAFKARGNKGVVFSLMEWSQKISALGREDQKDFLAFSIQFFRDAFLMNYALEGIVHFKSETDFDLTKFAPFVHSNNITPLVRLFEDAYRFIQGNGNAKMVFSDLSLQLTRLINSN